jgi:hypothetical protein
MAYVFKQEQLLMVSHRLNHVGRRRATTGVCWRYEGQSWPVRRPEDGRLPERLLVQCEVCDKTLTYSVHSVRSALRRQRRWRVLAYVATGLVVVGFLGVAFTWFWYTDWSTIPAATFALGLGSRIWFMQTPSMDVGVTGHHTTWPVAAKHFVSLPEYDPRAASLPAGEFHHYRHSRVV